MANFTYKNLKNSTNEIDQLLYKVFTSSFRTGYLEIGPQKYCLPELYLKFKEQLDNFQVAPNDLIVMTHPKTGTTWAQELIWLIKNDFDYETAKKVPPMDRVPFLDMSIIYDFQNLDPSDKLAQHLKMVGEVVGNSVKRAETNPHPRLIKTHLPWELLPQAIQNTSEVKIIYVYRNAKDVCLSYYHHCCIFEGFNGSLEEFVELFIAGRISYGPYFRHVESCFKQRERENVLFLNYEEMKKDLRGVVRTVAAFLGKEVPEEEMERLCAFLQFDNMKSLSKGDENGYKFFRSGVVGSFKKEMSEEMQKNLNRWIEKELAETKIDLPNLVVE